MRRHSEIPDAWQTKVQDFITRYMKISFPLPWLLISVILFLLSLLVGFSGNYSQFAFKYLGLSCLLIATIANGVIFFEHLIDETANSVELLLHDEQERVTKWVDGWYRTIFGIKANLLAGLIMGVVLTTPSFFYSPAFIDNASEKITIIILAFIVAFLGGSMLWVMSGIARLMLSLGKTIKIRASIFDTANSPLRAASGILWRVSVIAAFTYMLGLSIYFFCSIEMQILNIVIIGFFGLFLVLYFIIPQVNIHKTLVNIKNKKLQALVMQIDRSFDVVTEDPSPQNISRLRELFDLQKILNGKRAWSFGTNELLILISSVLIPIAIFLLKYFLQSSN